MCFGDRGEQGESRGYPQCVKEPRMPRKPKTQTTPQGAEIPIPKRRDFLRDLRKVSTPKPEPKTD